MRSTTSTHELYGFAFRLVRGDPQTTADVFQDTWLDAISHMGSLIQTENSGHGCSESPGGGLPSTGGSGWRVATRSRPTVTKSSLRHWTASRTGRRSSHLEQAAVVQASLLALPPERRQVLVEKYVEELSVAQIAAKTGKSPKAVESLLCRAREQFRALLGWYFADTKCGTDT